MFKDVNLNLNTSKVCYLDIETTGLSKYTHEITIIGIYDDEGNSNFYINGKNLDYVFDKLNEYDVIVTFNGKQFDIPFIEHKLQIKLEHHHLDLRYLLKEIGFTGGLKKIERELDIVRDIEVQGMDGYEAVRLWKRYKLGDNNALQKLLKYNLEDIKNLKYLLEFYIQTKNNLMTNEK